MARFLAVWLLALIAARASAQELVATSPASSSAKLPLELSWDAPEECGSAGEVRAELERIAGTPVDETLQPLLARVAIAHAGGKYTARMHTEHEGQAGERSLQAEDCPTLVRSVTLVLALAFGRGEERADGAASGGGSGSGNAGTGASAASTPEGTATGEGAARAETARENAPNTSISGFGLAIEDEPDAGRGPRFGLIFGGGAQLTLLPVVAPLLTAGVTLSFDEAYSLQLRASALPATSKTLHGASARFDGVLGTLLGCAHRGVLGLCAGARAGALRGQARGVSRSGSSTAPWYALVLAPSLAWPARSPVQVGLEGSLALSLYRPRFIVLGLAQMHRVPLLATDVSVLLRITP